MAYFDWRKHDDFPACCGNCKHWDYDYCVTMAVDCKYVEFRPCKVGGAVADYVGNAPHLLLLSADSHCIDQQCAFEPTPEAIDDYLADEAADRDYKQSREQAWLALKAS